MKAVEAAGQGFRTDSSRSSHSIRRDTDIYTWDLRYVGRQAAKVCWEEGWTLEEYTARLPAADRTGS